MIQVTIEKENDLVKGFSFHGHAGYAAYGQDIVCAAVSVLVINTMNSIEELTEEHFTSQICEEDGDVVFHLEHPKDSPSSQLLLKSMILGLEGIKSEYGKKYISIQYQK